MKGHFSFTANFKEREVADTFELTIEVPGQFPRQLPRVVETGRRIPRASDFHVNGDGTLCLGSPLRLMLKLVRHPTIAAFARECLIPYLFAISHKLQFGGVLPFDELAHGTPGVLADYAELFGLKPGQVRHALSLLGMRKRDANKQKCPCSCGRRLGCCDFRFRLDRFRELASRGRFREELRNLR